MTAEKVVALLKEKQLTVATAESCTAGLLSAALTAVSGASAVFGCGVAAYSTEIKHAVLGVPADVLAQHGTVSDETAAAMADGVRRLADATIGVAITGVAGPSETEGKPVGQVHIALANQQRVWVQRLTPNDTLTRDNIRQLAVDTALNMIWEFAEAYPTLRAGSIPISPPTVQEVVIPEAPPTNNRRRFLATMLPWKGDSLRERLTKCGVWLVSLCVLAAGIYGIHRLVSLSDNKSLYSNLQNLYVGEQTEDIGENGMLPRFHSLYLQNADIGGWLRIDGTAINYPIMKNAGSNYYANHNFRQEHSAYGAPYFDQKNNLMSATAHNKVFIVYGNNTADGQMFSELTDYRYIEFFKKHAVADMSTLFSADKWALFGVMVLDPNEINAFDYTNIGFNDDAAFTQYVTEIQKRSLFKTDIAVEPDDDLLLLVTQAEEEYGFDDALLVVVGRRIRDGETVPETVSVARNNTVLMPRKWVYMHRGTTTKRTTATTAVDTEGTTTTNEEEAVTSAVTTTETSTPSSAETTETTHTGTSTATETTTTTDTVVSTTEP